MDTLLVLFWIGLFLLGFWHWFLREWLEKVGVLGIVRGKLAAHQIPDEAYFEQVSREIRNGKLREGLWAKAWSDAGGDDNKAKAIYIRLRVNAMKNEAAQRFGETPVDDGLSKSASQEKTVVACPKCGVKLRMPIGKVLDVRCTKCSYEFRVDTGNKNRIE